MMKSIFQLFAFSLVLLLTACPTAIKKPQPDMVTPTQGTIPNSADYWFDLAKTAKENQLIEFFLNGIGSLLRDNQLRFLPEKLQQLQRLALNPVEKQRHKLYVAIAMTQQQQEELALKAFDDLTHVSFNRQDRKLQLLWHAAAYQLSSNFFEAAKKRIELSEIIEDAKQQQHNTDAIWQTLHLPTVRYLEIFKDSISENRILLGWIELVILNKSYLGKPLQMMQGLSLWKERFPLHPAQHLMPTELSSLTQVKQFKPHKIAILLPQTGNFAIIAKLIRQGIESAYYLDPQTEKPSLFFYDSNRSDTQQLYQQVINDGADFIIGPFKKSTIRKISQLENTNIPMLSLNILPNQQQTPSKHYQFGLPVENEARQIAAEFWKRKFTKVAVLIPDTSLGERALKAFKQEYERLDGEIVIQRHYIPGREASKVIKSFLAIDKSESRHQQLQRLLGSPLKFTQRRRQDIEAIFLVADATDGRRLKPMLDYYFAHDIPVFSTSRIHHGENNTRLDKDLGNIQFIDFPWLLEKNPQLQLDKQALAQLWPKSVSGQSAYLFAFGLDAYRLIDQLGVLEVFPYQYFRGATGRIFMNSKKQLYSILPWAQFKNGKPQIQQTDDNNKQPENLD